MSFEVWTCILNTRKPRLSVKRILLHYIYARCPRFISAPGLEFWWYCAEFKREGRKKKKLRRCTYTALSSGNLWHLITIIPRCLYIHFGGGGRTSKPPLKRAAHEWPLHRAPGLPNPIKLEPFATSLPHCLSSM